MNAHSLAAAILSVGVITLGCSTDPAPSPGLADPYPAPINNPQVTVVSPDLQQWLGFHPSVIVNDGRQPLWVQTPVRNLSDRQYLVDYRYLYLDENGAQISPVMGWKMIALEPKQTVYMEGRALDLSAKTFRLEVRWAR